MIFPTRSIFLSTKQLLFPLLRQLFLQQELQPRQPLLPFQLLLLQEQELAPTLSWRYLSSSSAPSLIRASNGESFLWNGRTNFSLPIPLIEEGELLLPQEPRMRLLQLLQQQEGWDLVAQPLPHLSRAAASATPETRSAETLLRPSSLF